jgi:hypothetical protein
MLRLFVIIIYVDKLNVIFILCIYNLELIFIINIEGLERCIVFLGLDLAILEFVNRYLIIF